MVRTPAATRGRIRTWISWWSNPNHSAKTETGEPKPCVFGTRFRASGFRKTSWFTAATRLSTGVILSITFSRGRFERERCCMRDLKMARALLDSAGRNVFALRSAVDTPDYPREVFGFHVQQAAEKVSRSGSPCLTKCFPCPAIWRCCRTG